MENENKNENTKLIGYARKSKAGGAIKLSLCVEDFVNADKYTTKDGREFVAMTISLKQLQAVISGEKEVTAVSQFINNN